MRRRLFSALLALVMVLGLLPAQLLPSFAAEPTGEGTGTSSAQTTPIPGGGKHDKAVTYNRAGEPEYAILNSVNGQNSKFYSTIKGDIYALPLGWRYNAIKGFMANYDQEGINGQSFRWGELSSGADDNVLADSNLAAFLKVPNNIEMNFSATAHNDTHTHTTDYFLYKYMTTVTSYATATLSFAGYNEISLSGSSELDNPHARLGDEVFYPVNYDAISAAKEFDCAKITITSPSLSYYDDEWRKCSCGRAKIDSFVFTLRDSKAPTLKSIWYSTDGTNWSQSYSIMRVGAGETLYIKLCYDEPIRFADDTADGNIDAYTRFWKNADDIAAWNQYKQQGKFIDKSNLYIQLLGEGDSESDADETTKAYLYKLDGNDLYFQYNVGTAERCEEILSFGTSSLFSNSSDIPLVQMGGLTLDGNNSGVFRLGQPDGVTDTNGFSTTTSYITDFAGNPIQSGTVNAGLLIVDTGAPYVKKISFDASLNNGDVKEARGVTNLTPADESYASSYFDTSDTHLGVGDTLYATIQMSERVDMQLEYIDRVVNGQQIKGYKINWPYAFAVTNLKDESGNYVTLRSDGLSPRYRTDRLPDDENYTSIHMAGVTITDGMTVDDANGEIKITKFYFDFTDASDAYKQESLDANGMLYDLTGNSFDISDVKIDPAANANPYLLDSIAPTVTGGSELPLTVSNLDGEEQQIGIRYGFTIGWDTEGGETAASASEFTGTYGSFVLTNGGDGNDYRYEYAVKSATEGVTVSESDWKEAKTGVTVRFKQSPEMVLFLRTIEPRLNPNYYAGSAEGRLIYPENAEVYRDLRDCQLILTACDYAGNAAQVTLPVNSEGTASTLDWYVDNLPPSIQAGSVIRELQDDGTGLLTAEVKFSDVHGISKWEYAWEDTGAIYDLPEELWQEGVNPTENLSATGEVTVSTNPITAPAQSLLRKHLWVRVTDNSQRKNTSVIYVGEYTYDLQQAEYGIRYEKDVMCTAELSINQLNAEDALVFIVTYLDGTLERNFVRVYTGGAVANGGTQVPADGIANIFEDTDTSQALWRDYGSVQKGSDGTYTFADARDAVVMADILGGNYAGSLSIKILSGRQGALDLSTGWITSAGNANGYPVSEEIITLKLTGNDPANNYRTQFANWPAEQQYPLVNFSCSEDLGALITDKDGWSGATRYLSTLDGLSFDVIVRSDRNGWSCEDIDVSASYVELVNTTDNTTYRVGLKPFTLLGDSSDFLARQTITFGAGDYTTGVYTGNLHLFFRSDANKGTNRTEYVVRYGITELNEQGEYSFFAPGEFVIDATAPAGNVQFKGITYTSISATTSNWCNIEEVYPDVTYGVKDDGILYLPIAGGDLQSGATVNRYTFTIESPDEADPVELTSVISSSERHFYTGMYVLNMWNAAYQDHVVTLRCDMNATNTDGVHAISNRSTGGFIVDGDADNLVRLNSDTVNTIVFQKVYTNGATQTVTVQIKPVTQHLTGSLSIDNSNGTIVFTPDEDTAIYSAGAKVYVYSYQNGQEYRHVDPTVEGSVGEIIELSLTQEAGSIWRAPLVEGGANYRAFTVNAYGSAWSTEKVYACERAPWFDELYNTSAFTDNGDGTYEIAFSLNDDYLSITDAWDQLTIGFAPEYSAASLKLSINDFQCESSTQFEKYSWVAGEKASATGIYAINIDKTSFYIDYNPVEYHHDYMNVRIKGVFLNAEGVSDMGLTVSATDTAGNYTAYPIAAAVNYKAPEVVSSSLTNQGLILTFNQPVYPQETWAFRNSDDKDFLHGTELYQPGYKTLWCGAFPVVANGTHQLALLDVSGTPQIVPFTTDVFTDSDGNDWSLAIDWSEKGLTKDPVSITAKLINRPSDKAGLWIEEMYENEAGVKLNRHIIPEGVYDGTETPDTMTVNSHRYSSEWMWSVFNYDATSTPRTVKREANGELEVWVFDARYSEVVGESETSIRFRQRIHLDNIADAAPEATVYYYASGIGMNFTYDGLEAYVGEGATIYGDIVACYTTSRSVTPTGDTGTSFTFTADNAAASHTFTYADAMDNAGSAEAKLPANLTLKPLAVSDELAAQKPADVTAPTVSVDLYYLDPESEGSYIRGESFGGTDTPEVIKQRFENLGYVRGYRLAVNASDLSGFDIAVSEGVTMTGNLITVTAASAFTITVTDRSENHNAVTVSITADMFSKLDNTAPAVDLTAEKGSSLYDRRINIALSDNVTLADPDADTVTVLAPIGTTRTGKNAYTYLVHDNGILTVSVRDIAGNRATGTINISGVDTDPPTLSATWSPAYTYVENGVTKVDYSRPTENCVNTNVVAVIGSDKAMSSLSVQIAGTTVDLLSDDPTKSVENPYSFRIYEWDEPALTIQATPERITVVYRQSYYNDLVFTAGAPNGKTRTFTLDQYPNVDKEAPRVILDQQTPLTREGYSVPYAVQVELVPDEPATSPNYGSAPDRFYDYREGNSLFLTFTANGEYGVKFVDAAGNIGVHTVTIADIDRTEPKVTLGELNSSGQSATIDVTVDEACVLTWGESGRHEFTAPGTYNVEFIDNGSYAVIATDAAGNESINVVTVGTIDKILPSLVFDTSTVYLMQNSSVLDLDHELRAGINLSDNVTSGAELLTNLQIDTAAVDLRAAGIYTVVYTVADAAGNTLQVNRFVQIIDENTVCIMIDGKLIMPGGTAVINPDEQHYLTLSGNCTEPYTIKARAGIFGTGQMKYLIGSTIRFGEDGSFTVDELGYYTLLVTTQSRQTIRIRMVVER